MLGSCGRIPVLSARVTAASHPGTRTFLENRANPIRANLTGAHAPRLR